MDFRAGDLSDDAEAGAGDGDLDVGTKCSARSTIACAHNDTAPVFGSRQSSRSMAPISEPIISKPWPSNLPAITAIDCALVASPGGGLVVERVVIRSADLVGRLGPPVLLAILARHPFPSEADPAILCVQGR